MKVLGTGAAGFIWMHRAQRLLERGGEVVVLDRQAVRGSGHDSWRL